MGLWLRLQLIRQLQGQDGDIAREEVPNGAMAALKTRPKAKCTLDLVGLRPRFYRGYRTWS